MNRVSSELHKNQRASHSKLESAKAPEKVKDTFRRKPCETLAEYAERRVREDICGGCFGAANNDCGVCGKRGRDEKKSKRRKE